VRTARRRVLRVMREEGLLAPSRVGRPHGSKAHDGTIVTERPDVLWGTDQTGTLTGEGNAAIFFVIDHCTAECLGIHAARRGTRFEALEPLRQGVRNIFGSFAAGIAAGVQLRHDHGSQYVSDHFQSEIAFLGFESSPAFVRAPQGNGCIERFFRTLKEQLLWVRSFRDAEHVRQAVAEWIAIYNENWLIERHGHRSPAAVRRELLALKVPA
jgi:transposase InsO family protein